VKQEAGAAVTECVLRLGACAKARGATAAAVAPLAAQKPSVDSRWCMASTGRLALRSRAGSARKFGPQNSWAARNPF
jgi:ABC-type hemin transport system substrate-binding protein